MTTLPVLDRSTLDAIEALRSGGAATLRLIYGRDLPMHVLRIEEALAAGDLATVARSAHTLTGASMAVGALALAEGVRACTAAARAGDLETSRIRWQDLQALRSRTITALAEYQP